jgi:hypothetical protein
MERGAEIGAGHVAEADRLAALQHPAAHHLAHVAMRDRGVEALHERGRVGVVHALQRELDALVLVHAPSQSEAIVGRDRRRQLPQCPAYQPLALGHDLDRDIDRGVATGARRTQQRRRAGLRGDRVAGAGERQRAGHDAQRDLRTAHRRDQGLAQHLQGQGLQCGAAGHRAFEVLGLTRAGPALTWGNAGPAPAAPGAAANWSRTTARRRHRRGSSPARNRACTIGEKIELRCTYSSPASGGGCGSRKGLSRSVEDGQREGRLRQRQAARDAPDLHLQRPRGAPRPASPDPGPRSRAAGSGAP